MFGARKFIAMRIALVVLILLITSILNTVFAQFKTDTIKGNSYMMHNLRYPDYCLGEAKGRIYFLARTIDDVSPALGDSVLVEILDSKSLNLIRHKSICLSRIDKKIDKKGGYYKEYNINNVLVNDSGIHVIGYKRNPYDFENIYYTLLLDSNLNIVPNSCNEFLKVKDSKIGDNISEHRFFDKLSHTLDSSAACDFYFTKIMAGESNDFTLILNSYSYDFKQCKIEQRKMVRPFKGAKWGAIINSLFVSKDRMLAILLLSDTLLMRLSDEPNNNDFQICKTKFLIDVDFASQTFNSIPLSFGDNYLEGISFFPRSKSEVSICSYYGSLSEPYIYYPEKESVYNFGSVYKDYNDTYRIYSRKGFFNINYNTQKGTIRNRVICELDSNFIKSVTSTYKNVKYKELTLMSCIELKSGIALVNWVEGRRRDPQIKSIDDFYNLTYIENKKIKFSKNIPRNIHYNSRFSNQFRLYSDTSRTLINFIALNQHLKPDLNDQTLRVIEYNNQLYSYIITPSGDITYKSFDNISLTKNIYNFPWLNLSQSKGNLASYFYFTAENINKKKGISMNTNLSVTFKKIVFH